MRIRTFDELTNEQETERSLLHLNAFSGTFSARAIDLYRRRLHLLPDYTGVFAVEGGHLLGQVFVLRVPYVFREGLSTMSGIAVVATRPDRGRSGVARALLVDAHRREREEGLEFASLWTNRSWGAHHLYEELGYRDIYSATTALHAAVDRPGPAPRRPTVRVARRGDLEKLERLHARTCEGRLGYAHRPEGFFRVDAELGGLDLEHLCVAREGGDIVGYAQLDLGSSHVACPELVAGSAVARRALIRRVERVARGRPYAFQYSAATDDPGSFRAPGYAHLPVAWYGMMGLSLRRSISEREARRVFATDDPKFLCFGGDRF